MTESGCVRGLVGPPFHEAQDSGAWVGPDGGVLGSFFEGSCCFGSILVASDA